MTDPDQNSLLLAPASCGWRALMPTQRAEWIAEESNSFAEAVASGLALAEGVGPNKGPRGSASVQVAVPVRCGVFERLTLPSLDREELDSMVRLQFEKNLPYPVEETAFGFQVLSQTETETTLMACAAHEPVLTELCGPLLERTVPKRLTFWAMQIAAQARLDSTVAGFWREEGKLLFGIFENQRVGYVETLVDGNDLRSLLPGLLMRAEIAGARTVFAEILLDPALQELEPALAYFAGIPIRAIASEGSSVEGVDLTPPKWREDQARVERRARLRKRIAVAGAAYVAVLVACLVFLGLQGRQIESLRHQAAALQPQVDAVIERQARWQALAPAVDPHRFSVELLFQAWQCLPSPDTRITRFELGRNQLILEGEAPNAQQAIEYAEKLKASAGLADYRFEAGPPALLPNEHAQFRIFGKQ